MALVGTLQPKKGMLSYALAMPPSLSAGLKIGASVAVDGCCQTVVKIESTLVYFDAVQETLDKTGIGSYVVSQAVNVERSVRMGEEIGGQFLSGHIYGTAVLKKILRPDPQNLIFEITCPPSWMRYIFEKGLIALDGVSLTVNGPLSAGGSFHVHLIPETLRQTTFSMKTVGKSFNVEIDTLTQAIVNTTEKVLQNR